jgi:hypothetical protein
MKTIKCTSCFGDGIERCDNPDHGLLNALSFRGSNESACPCCGHDEHYRMRSWDHECGKYKWNKCPDCDGSGEVKAKTFSEVFNSNYDFIYQPQVKVAVSIEDCWA